MIRAAAAVSTHWNTARAAREVGERVAARFPAGPVDFVVVFATAEHAAHLATLQATLSGVTGTPYIVGCSAAGVLTADGEIEDGPALGVLAVSSDQLHATPFLFPDVGDRGLTAGTRVGQRLAGSRDSHDVLVVFPDPFSVRPDRLLQGLDATLGRLPVVGGAASARGLDGRTFQFCGTEASEAAVAGLRLGGRFRHRAGVTQGCRPLCGPLRVTEAHENLILELDGTPAIEALARVAPAELVAEPARAMNYLFVGLLPDRQVPDPVPGDYLLRNIMALDRDAGVLAISERVEEGQYLLFALREPSAAREDLARLLDEVRTERTGLDYRFGLYFNCLSRGQSLYEQPGIDSALIRRALPGVELLGFFSNAEIGPLSGTNQVFTYTGVLALFAE